MASARSATATLIEQSQAPRARRRRSEARAKVASVAVAYLRVSTEEQAASGLGLEAQRATIEAYAEANGIEITEWFADEGISGATIGKRPQMLAALAALDAGHAGVLLAKDASRLSRTKEDFGQMVAAATADGWCIRTADGLIDTCDPQGALLPHFLAVVAELERMFTSQRTRDALAAAKARGVKVGRPSTLADETRERIVAERDAGKVWQAIADDLNADEIPTGRGGAMWRPAAVRAAYLSAKAA